MSLIETREANLLEAVVADYEAKGFSVFVRPSPSILPSFLRPHRLDAVAIKPEKKIAIEITRSTKDSTTEINRLRKVLSPHPEWELVVFHASLRSAENHIEVAPLAAIDGAIEEVNQFKDSGYLLLAVILAWATLEATARALLPDQLARPQTSRTLIEALATQGFLTPREADSLRSAASLRDAAAHGQLDLTMEPSQFDELLAVLRTLIGFLPENSRDN
jgi:uncharacterized protein YutE (UPF0331/DUF86 family)